MATNWWLTVLDSHAGGVQLGARDSLEGARSIARHFTQRRPWAVESPCSAATRSPTINETAICENVASSDSVKPPLVRISDDWLLCGRRLREPLSWRSQTCPEVLRNCQCVPPLVITSNPASTIHCLLQFVPDERESRFFCPTGHATLDAEKV